MKKSIVIALLTAVIVFVAPATQAADDAKDKSAQTPKPVTLVDLYLASNSLGHFSEFRNLSVHDANSDSGPLPPRSFLDIKQRFLAFSCRGTFWRTDGTEDFLLGHPDANLADFPRLNMPRGGCTTEKQQSNNKGYDLLHCRSRASP